MTKHDLRQRAVALRLEGRAYSEIRSMLGVSKSTLSIWLRDVPLTEEHRLALTQRRDAPAAQRARTRRALRLRRNEELMAQARAEITGLSDRELFIAGVVAYWAEGAKNKPWGSTRQATFANSDAGLVRLYLAWLRLLGIHTDRLILRVSIHESADADAAVRYWAGVAGVPESDFRPTTLKRHNPKTVRKNVGDGYHGCLYVQVRRSNGLNLLITGWCQGLADLAGTLHPRSGVV